ncbi:ribosome hibernation promoting factor [Marinospirillum insulare]|uniref:Ribosome hibernation promoting factor n=1 Tax=Marinospirillum insulare TaxID=217169 RepID=A0ABQ5ZYV9_9GAMM|nr:ribosome hibernation promoting factor [Marinospirillum insulare]GLR63183.1 ribosome hibernation promoting factor HPF [Marinospirillum insulare]
MQINITGHHVELTPALREFVENKFAKLERFFDQIISIQVTLTIDKLRQIAESDIKIAGGDVHASSESEDMYASIDQLMDKLERQLIKHKEKTQARQQGATH